MAEEDYNSWTVADLKSEIDARNEEREADDHIDKVGNKADLIAALELDDEEFEKSQQDADDEDSDDETPDEPADGDESDEEVEDGETDTPTPETPAEDDTAPGVTTDSAGGKKTNATGPYVGPDEDGPVNYGDQAVPPQDGKVLKWDEEETFEADDQGTVVVVKENVYREFYHRNTRRPSYKLVYAKGQVVPKGMLKPVGTEADQPGE